MKTVILESHLTCPHCGFTKQETMSVDACQYFYERTKRKVLLKPKTGDYCVFCSYGTAKYPPIQAQAGCCK